MKSLSKPFVTAKAKVNMLIASAALLASQGTLALNKIDLTNDTSGGKNFDNIAANIDGAAQTGAALFIQIVTIMGFVVVAISLWTLYKASKDEREKPTSAIVGLFIGGAMAAVGTIMWIMKNTITG